MILVVTEGVKDEPALFQILGAQGFFGDKQKIVSYGTNIHSLIYKLKEYPEQAEGELDIALILREVDRMTNHGQGAELLSQKYSDILLVFDLDPQDPNCNLDDIFNLVRCFSNDTTEGKLFINYPMFESLFVERDQVSLHELSTKGEFKNKAHRSEYWRKFDKQRKGRGDSFTREDSIFLCDHHLKKFKDITEKSYMNASMEDLFLKQKECIEKENAIFCINTSILSILDFSSIF